MNKTLKTFGIILIILGLLFGAYYLDNKYLKKEPKNELLGNIDMTTTNITEQGFYWSNETYDQWLFKSGSIEYDDLQINMKMYNQVPCECAKNTLNPCMAFCFELKEGLKNE